MRKSEIKMTEEKIKERLLRQLCDDYSCSMEQIKSKENVLTRKEYRLGRRIFRGDDCFLKSPFTVLQSPTSVPSG